MKYIIFILLLSIGVKGQEYCNLYVNPPKYEISKDVNYSLSYVSCLHSKGVVAEVGTDKYRISSLITGPEHHNSAYLISSRYFTFNNCSLSGGLLYRVNNSPSMCLGVVGTDIKVYKNLYSTFNLLQVNTNLNYIYVGLKVTI